MCHISCKITICGAAKGFKVCTNDHVKMFYEISQLNETNVGLKQYFVCSLKMLCPIIIIMCDFVLNLCYVQQITSCK